MMEYTSTHLDKNPARVLEFVAEDEKSPTTTFAFQLVSVLSCTAAVYVKMCKTRLTRERSD